MRKTLAFFILLGLAACDGNDNPKPDVNDYLPLAVGNHWNFRAVGWDNDRTIQHREVVDEVEIDTKKYFLLVSISFPIEGPTYKDSAYYRIDTNGYVYVFRKDAGPEANLYRLGSKDGDSWTYKTANGDDVIMRVSEVNKDIDVAVVRHCKDYSFDAVQWTDDNYTYTLAPGVGFLKEYSDAWGGGLVLKSANINGKEIEY
jgi:hypothetical protein